MQKFHPLGRALFKFAVAILFSCSIVLFLFWPASPRVSGAAYQGSCPSPIFTAQTAVNSFGRPRPVVAADFNGDGKPDLAIGNSISLFGGVTYNNVNIMLNNGQGGFTVAPGAPIGLGDGPISIATGDFNGDARPDLAVAGEASKSITILLGNGTGAFTTPGAPIAFSSRPTFVISDDFNRDGRLDLAVAKADDNNVSILLGLGNGNFSESTGSPIAVGTAPFFLASGNFNGEPSPDLAVANLNSSNVSILLNNGAGRFTQAAGSPITMLGRAYSVAVADFNGDTLADLVVKNTLTGTSSGYLTVLLGNGSGGFTPAPRGAVAQPTVVGFFGYAVPGDFDRDNRMDIVVANPDNSDVAIWYGDGTGGFRVRQRISTLFNSYAVAVADYDGTGTPDLAVTFESQERFVIFLTGCGATINTPPTITASTALTRQQGTPVAISTIATVGDVETNAGNLSVTATTVPAGLSVMNIRNSNGTVTANVTADCNAATGANTIVLSVTDAGNLISTANLTVNVTSNTPPSLGAYAATTVPAGGSTTVSPTDAPADNGTVGNVFAAASSGFTGTLMVNPVTGQVAIANAGPVGNYTVTVTVTDNCSATTIRTFPLTVGAPPNTAPSITPSAALSRQQGSLGVASPIALVSDIETSPANLSVTVTNLPAGIAVTGISNSNGAITATVLATCSAALGANTVQLTVTDGGNLSSTANLTVNVTANTPPSLGYGNQQTVTFGGSLTINPASGPNDNGTVTSINVRTVTPTFGGTISVNAAGTISVSNAGAPGNYTVTIRATDNCGATTDASFTLSVGCQAITLAPATLPGGAIGASYNQSLSQTGAAGTATFSLSNGSLPPGLVLSPAGQITGTPAQAGNFAFTIRVADQNGCAGTRDYSIGINCPNISLSPGTLPNGNVGSPYNQTITANGGTGPYTFSVFSGSLPGGLMLSNAGVISGIPSAAGTFNATIRAADAGACSGQTAIQIVIEPRLITSVSSANYRGERLTTEMITAAFGTGLANATLAASTLPLPIELGGTAVRVRDAVGTERAAQLFFVSPNQVNYLIPAGTTEGNARVTITAQDGTVSSGNISIGRVAPGLYSANASGLGLAAANVLRVKADGTQIFEPITRFEASQGGFVPVPIDLGPASEQVFLLLFGTGFRNLSALSAVSVTIGGVDAPVFYAGPQGSLVGLDQLNVLIPRALLGRGLVDVIVRVDGQAANTIQVAVK